MSKQEPQSWFAPQGGLQFECTGCGACCRRDGVVHFEKEDILRVSEHLEMTPESFVFMYLTQYEGMWVVEVDEHNPCLFLDEHQRCTIHEVKPLQCATYPFWPEVLENEHDWQEEAKWCEGIGHGELISLVEIAQRRLEE